MGKPNILFVVTDELRPDCVGFEGNGDVRTPHLDALTGDGVRFASTYCTAPVCAPSRYSLLSSTYVHEHRGSTNYCTMLPELESFPRLLKSARYRTAAVGKMHLTPTYLDVGFETMMLAEQDGPGRFEDDYHRELMANGLIDRLDIMDQRKEFRERAPRQYWETFGAEASSLPEKWHSTSWIGERAVELMSNWREQGECLMVSFVKPHHPFDPPARWLEGYDPQKLRLLPGWTEEIPAQDLARNGGYFPHGSLNEDALRRVLAHYYATISHLDEQVGRLTSLLKRRGLYESTLIIFTADHGDYMGFHHMLLKANHMYEPLGRVPLVVKFPGGVGRGTVRQDLVSLVDVPTTILGCAGVAPAASMRGLHLGKGDTGREFVFALAGHGNCMARSRRFKLLSARPGERELFFDLERDPLELENLIDDPAYRDQIQRHRQARQQWWPGEPPVKPHLDLHALTIPRSRRNPEIPAMEVQKYFAGKMEEYFKSVGA